MSHEGPSFTTLTVDTHVLLLKSDKLNSKVIKKEKYLVESQRKTKQVIHQQQEGENHES